MMVLKSAKKYTPTQVSELSRRFKEVAEAFEEDPKQIMAVHQAHYIAEKQKQVFDDLIAQKRKKMVERQQSTQPDTPTSGSEVARLGEEKSNEVN